MILPIPLPDGTVVDFPGIVPKLSETPGATKWLGPTLGEHVEEVLASIGITGAALDELRAEGVI
jgi:formyl-CoA transferase